MSAMCPTLVIGGTGSGVGKTSLTLGLARCLARQGLRVQTFKVGPDFLDPSYLKVASGRTCYNLDGWMTSRDYVRRLFARATADADIAVIEGVMGLFDGASALSLEGSTAEIAFWLDAPVLLIANVHGVARSLAATVKGFTHFDPELRVAGVIGNHGGSPNHRTLLSEALSAAGSVPLVGMVPRNSLPPLPSRHLGLVAAEHAELAPGLFDELADACSQHLDIPAILALARTTRPLTIEPPPDLPPAAALDQRLRVGIARDEAFHFYYPDNLEELAGRGVTWVPFSPLTDQRLPPDLDGLYFGGGYPELHAARLAANASMLADVRDYAASGRVVYGECGGMMYLGRTLTTSDGTDYSLAGVLPIRTAMLQKFSFLGYAEVRWLVDSIWGSRGEAMRGHEYHYSQMLEGPGPTTDWEAAYTLHRGRRHPWVTGLSLGNILAGYVHLHWASRPAAAARFLSCCRRSS